MLIGETRLFELVQIIASGKDGMVSAEEFRAAAYPDAKKTRGSRRILAEIVAKGLAEVRGGKYAVTYSGLAFLRGEGPSEPAKVSREIPGGSDSSFADQLMQMAVRRGVRVPGPPVTRAHRASDGMWVMYGPRHEIWYTPGPETPWRCKSGPPGCKPDTLFELAGSRVRVRPRTRDWVPLSDTGGMMHPPRQDIFSSETAAEW